MGARILVVDDSFMMRTIIKDLVSADPELEIVGEAENGLIALEKVKELKPDVVLLDIEMPELSGLEAMKRMMLTSKAKIIIISSVAQVGSAEATRARSLGAYDVIAKPSGSMSLDLGYKKGHQIVQTIRKAAGMPV